MSPPSGLESKLLKGGYIWGYMGFDKGLGFHWGLGSKVLKGGDIRDCIGFRVQLGFTVQTP